MRLIDADKIVEVSEHAYGEWNFGMAAAEWRQINRCFKMQELCKAVKGVADDCPTIDPESLRPTAHWKRIQDVAYMCTYCKSCFAFIPYNYQYCPECGAKMLNAYAFARER